MRIITAIFRLIIRWLKLLFGAEKPSNSVRLLTSDGYVLTDLNGIIITIKE